MAGFPGVTEAVFLARQSAALDHEPHNKKNGSAMLYTCGNNEHRSKAHAQQLKSRAHTTTTTTTRVSSQDDFEFGTTPTVKSLTKRKEDFYKGSDGREKMFDETARTISRLKIDGVSSDEDLDEDEADVVDPTSCFMCDRKHKTIDSCMIHLHKQHGLFIPDIEYLKDPEGLLTYLGEKVKRDYTCLYCNINCQPFESLEAVRMHMVAKSHCRVHYGDATDEEEEPELDEFYDYSSSYVDGNGKQLVTTSDGISNSITLGCSGAELIISRATDDGVSTKALGSREYLRYYRQKPHPTPDSVCVTALRAARYRSMSLSALQLKEKMERMNLMKQIMRQMNRSRAETMRCRMSMRCNPIRNLRPINALH